MGMYLNDRLPLTETSGGRHGIARLFRQTRTLDNNACRKTGIARIFLQTNRPESFERAQSSYRQPHLVSLLYTLTIFEKKLLQ